MKIGIISAVTEEIQQFKKILKKYTKKNIGLFPIYLGKFQKINIILIQSGVGKVFASMSTMILINIYNPKYIINIGSAGSLNPFLKIGDIIVPKYICYYDVNLTNFGYSLGQIPGLPKKFNNNTLSDLIYQSAKKLQYSIHTGLLVSGDSFICNSNTIVQLKKKFRSAIAVEMEAAAISQVCYKFYTPLIVIKYISDLSNKNATINFKKNVSFASQKSLKLIKNILYNII